RAIASDALSISELLHEIGYLKYINEEAPAETEARIRDGILSLSHLTDHVLLVATEEESDTVLGYAAAHFYANLLIGNEGYISELYLRPSATNKGIGSKLLATLEDEGRSRNCRRLRLTNWRIRESYQRGFYAKHGWQENSDAAEFVRLF
ncbi:MAG: N-acetyltransferase family protein, partial [Ktedonobacterales bacterium]